MNNPVILGFYGFSNTGKTALLTSLIKKLTKKEYNVCSVKQTNQPYSIDSAAKDTWKYAQAGANLVCFNTAIETSFIINQSLSFENIKQIIKCIGYFDIILVEGAHDREIQKIRLDQRTPIRHNTLLTYTGNSNEIMSLIMKKIGENKKYDTTNRTKSK